MPDDERLVYWDACCFLSYINGDTDRVDVLEALLDDSKNNRSPLRIVTSTLSITEVAYAEEEKLSGASPEDVSEQIQSMWDDSEAIRFAEQSKAVAERARLLIRRARLAKNVRLDITDAIHLATAVQMGATEFHTYDDKLQKFEDITGLTIGEPTTLQAARVPRPSSPVASEMSTDVRTGQESEHEEQPCSSTSMEGS